MRLIHGSIEARIGRVCDPETCERYAVLHQRVHGPVIEMTNVIPGDFSRAVEALRGQGIAVLWAGFMSDINYGRRVAHYKEAH
jgi:hypothetical protein